MAPFSIDGNVEQRYKIQRHIGNGAYGVVWSAMDRLTGRHVALKKVFDAFRNQEDAQRTYREIMLLEHLKNNKRIVRLINVIRAANNADLYLVFELAETDLSLVLRKHILQSTHRQYIIFQILHVVAQLHAMHVIHRDLKPANVFIYSDCSIKLGDFGLARCFLGSKDVKEDFLFFSDYIATRWYRSPEILVKSSSYTTAMDMWAVGCILTELFLDGPLFPGHTTQDQLVLIISALGEPSSEDIDSLRSPDAWSLIDSLPDEIFSVPLCEQLKQIDPCAADLISNLIVFNPSKRLTAAEALQHPYVAPFLKPEDTAALAKMDAVTLPLPDEKRYTTTEYKENVYARIAQEYQHREYLQCL